MPRKRTSAAMLCIAMLLSGCGVPAAASQTPSVDLKSVAVYGSSEPGSGQQAASGPVSAPVKILEASFHSSEAEGANGVLIDLSSTADGYVAVSAVSENRLKFQVRFGEETYNYNLASDGTASIFPLSLGSGEYRFRVMENVVESKYAELYATSCSVTLRDEFQPFLRPSDYVPYSGSSRCVAKAAELTANCTTDSEKVAAVYTYICDTVRYDHQKASTVQSGYLPDPDETMATGLGICFDYAALAAAMLRSLGIPTREIFGYVSPNDVYHAWNMFYSAEQGWVTVSFEMRANDWNRMDATFAANGADDTFIGDGGNYTDLYCY